MSTRSRLIALLAAAWALAVASPVSAQSIEGAIYDVTTATELPGAQVSLRFADDDPVAPGTLVAADNLIAGQQQQITQIGGRYRFDVQNLAATRRLRIEVVTGALNFSFPSRELAARSELAPSGPVIDSVTPLAGAAGPYYLRFAPIDASFEVTNNHIPLDPLSGTVTLALKASKRRAEVGDIVTFNVAIENGSARDLSGSSRAAFVRLVLGRGIDLDNTTVAASISGGARFSPEVGGTSSGDRLVRIGPLEMPAGARAQLEFRATIGADFRNGRGRTNALLVDGGGVALSNPASVDVDIERGRGIESSVIVGRVFCDRDGDAVLDKNEPGVFGAKVYLDSGSFAITDSEGLYHFGRVAEGTRLVKLDSSSLGASSPNGDRRQLLRMTAGLPGKANFPVDCRLERVSGTTPLVTLSHRHRPIATADPGLDQAMTKRLLIEGELILLGVKLDGTELTLPTASARLEAPDSLSTGGGDGINLATVPAGGYGVERPRFILDFSPPSGVVATRWVFVISPAPTSSGRGKPIFTLSGEGEPPAAIDWDGRIDGGKVAESDHLYVAQLVVIGSRAKIEAASRLVPFGIAFGAGAAGPSSQVWNGTLFEGQPNAPTASAPLTTNIEALARSIQPGDRIEISVHAATAKSRVEALARTQAQADLVKSLLGTAGVDTTTIVSRGRGIAEPIATGANSDAKNRRIEINIARAASPNAGRAVPATVSTSSSALIEGQPVESDDSGRFRWEGAVPDRGAILIDVQAQDGRRAAIDLALSKDGSQSPNRVIREVRVEADLTKGDLTVGGRPLDARLLSLDIAIKTSTTGGPTVITPSIPEGLKSKSIEISLSDDSGKRERLAVAGSGVDVSVPSSLSGAISAQLVVELVDGSRAYSPRRTAGGVANSSQSLTVNGVAWPVVGGKAEGIVEVPEGGAVLVDASVQSGQRALFVVVSAKSETVRPSGDITIGPDDSVMPDFRDAKRRRKAVHRSDLLASEAAKFWIDLPPSGSTVARRLPVRGKVAAGSKLLINGRAVATTPTGSFMTIAELPVGASDLLVVVEDKKGFRAELRRPLKARGSELFAMALGEMILSTSITTRGLFGDTAYLAGMTPDTTWSAGPLRIHGRGTLYLTGELSPSSVFKKVRFTAHLDTSKRANGSAFFEDVLNPARDEPTFGDSAIEVREANGRGKLYAKVEADKSTVVVGALAAELGRGSLFRYGRTVDGVGVNIERDLGSATARLDGFTTTAAADSVRDHVVFRSTGGTLYYTRFSDVIEGSELLRVIIRDRNTGMAVSERKLRRNVDYTIDYLSGRFWLINPVASSQASSWVLGGRESSLSPDSGDPIYIEARYEHRDSAASTRAVGAEASIQVGDVTIAAGGVGELRDSDVGDPGGNYGLYGARASYEPGERTKVSAEIARSRRREGDVEISIDGGLSFRDLAWAESFENPQEEPAYAWSVGARIAGSDVATALGGVNLSLYAQDIGRSYSAIGSELERGRLKFGGVLTTALGTSDDLLFRHQADVSEVPRIGPTSADLDPTNRFALDERATYMTSVGWVGRRGSMTHRIEAAHQRLTSTAARGDGSASIDARRLGAGVRSSLQFTDRIRLEAFQDVWTGLRDTDPVLNPIDSTTPTSRDSDPLAGITTGVGLGWRLLPDATFTSELRQRWNGDQSAAVGLRAKLSERGSFYISERAVRTPEGPAAVTVIGADDRFGPSGGGRSYGEYQLENTSSGTRNRAVLGLGHKWRVVDNLSFGVGFEHQQIFGGFLPDGTPVGNNQRDLARASIDLTVSKTARIGASVELRTDRSSNADDVDRELLDADPRDPSGGGFADHGGIAPGAPLVLGDKDITQVVGNAGLAWRPEEGVSVFARGRGARTTSGVAIGFVELTTGLAYRSLLNDRLAMLLRYSFIRERRPDDLALAKHEAHVLALVPVADLSKHWRLSGKVALKRSVESGGLAGNSSSSAVLSLARLGYRIHGNWDATVEARSLVVSQEAREVKLGSLVELGYYFDDFFRFGLGYNFSHFNDQELGDLTRDAHGVFIRLTTEL